MKNRNGTVSDIHFFHKLWLNELIFYKRENAIYSARIEEIIKGIKFNASDDGANGPLKEVLKAEGKITALNEGIEKLKWMINQQDHQIWDMHPAHSLESEDDICGKFKELQMEFESLKKEYNHNKKQLNDKLIDLSIAQKGLHNLPLYVI